jgi:hypothetical protein
LKGLYLEFRVDINREKTGFANGEHQNSHDEYRLSGWTGAVKVFLPSV